MIGSTIITGIVIIFSAPKNKVIVWAKAKIRTIENRTYLLSAVKLNKANYFQKLKFKSDWFSLWASLVVKK